MTETVGIIGAGVAGKAIAQFFLTAGRNVVISNSRGPDSLGEVIAELGAGAEAGTTARRLASDRPAGRARLCPGTGRAHPPLTGRLRRWSRPRLAAAARPAPGPGGSRQAGGRHHGPFGRSRTRFPGRAVAREESPLAAPGPAGPVPQPAEPGTGSSSG
jgi:hypothetical protein